MSNFLFRAREVLEEARKNKGYVSIVGQNTKAFYGNDYLHQCSTLSTTDNCGIIDYDPTELVVRVKCGTSIMDLEKELDRNNQFLNFEPPQFFVRNESGNIDKSGSVGGMVASGLSGPGRFFYGGCRESVLGMSVLDGAGRILTFGGSVIKNVAGYDVSRLNVGALGSLGLITEVYLRTYPKPMFETTMKIPLKNMSLEEILSFLNIEQIPISATYWTTVTYEKLVDKNFLYVRISGKNITLKKSIEKIFRKEKNSQELEDGTKFWSKVRNQELNFFSNKLANNVNLWRLSIPNNVELNIVSHSEMVVEWNGSLRWIKSEDDPMLIRKKISNIGGHATLYRGTEESRKKFGCFTPLDSTASKIHTNIKKVFDRDGIFNPGRLYSFM